MSLFEKVFNHQILARLEDYGVFTVTSHERSWLKTMLGHPAAVEAFTAETLSKLHSLLEPDPEMDSSRYLIEKARSMEKQVYHPLLRTLRRQISDKSGIRMTYEIKGGEVYTDHFGLPYKLEYSMVKREWYLLWYRFKLRTFMSTRLNKIHSVSAEPVKPEIAEQVLQRIGQTLESRKREAVIEIVPDYKEELSRILYAFSCFEKEVEYDTVNDTFRIRVQLLGDEMEYLLTKIRFLGKRVRVTENDYLKKRMLEASKKALARYGVYPENEEKYS